VSQTQTQNELNQELTAFTAEILELHDSDDLHSHQIGTEAILKARCEIRSVLRMIRLDKKKS